MSGFTLVETILDQAEAALEAGEPENALELCNRVLTRSPQHPGANFVKGDALRVLGELLDAADAYREAALAQPDHAASWASLALTSFEILDFEEARRSVSRSVREDPRNPEAWWVRSLLQEWRGDFAGAQRSLSHAQWLDPVGFPMPPTLTDDEVERLVEQAILHLHPDIRTLFANVTIILDEIPGLDVLLDYHPPASPLEILGYFSGHSVMEKSTDEPWSQLPASIVLFRRNLSRISNDRSELVNQLKITLFHEIGHFLGLNEEDLTERGLD
jgi:predicted Zn-dependent protease with MMP-like domain